MLSSIDPFPKRLMGYDDMPTASQRFRATFNWSRKLMDEGSGRLHAVQDQVQQHSGLHPRPTTHLAYRTCGIRLAGTSTSGSTRPSLERKTLTMGDGLPAFILRLTHRDSIELVAASAPSSDTTRFEMLPLDASR